MSLQLPDRHGITPLLAAIYEDHEECVKFLIEKVCSYMCVCTHACVCVRACVCVCVCKYMYT